jgi:uncharacterized protein (TIGR03643 family)
VLFVSFPSCGEKNGKETGSLLNIVARSAENKKTMNLKHDDLDRLIRMAWEDRTPFDAIKQQFNISQNGVIKIMRKTLSRSAFIAWRKRASNRKTKHLRTSNANRFRSKNQSSHF